MPRTKDGGYLLDDSPLIDPEIIDRIINAIKDGEPEKIKEILIPIERVTL